LVNKVQIYNEVEKLTYKRHTVSVPDSNGYITVEAACEKMC